MIPLHIPDVDDTPHMLDAVSPHHIRSLPVRFGDLVAHHFDYPTVRVTSCSDPYQGSAQEDFFEHTNLGKLIIGPRHQLAGISDNTIAMLPAREYIEPTSYRDARSGAQAHE
jgi:hypothetical protein